MARAQGLFDVACGAWPLLHLRSFEFFFGPRRMKGEQDWLVKTVSGLLVAGGWGQLGASASPESLAQARRVGMGTALTLLAVDVAYIPRGRIRFTHVLDAAAEAMWLVAWMRAGGISGPERCKKPLHSGGSAISGTGRRNTVGGRSWVR
ncbi:hypothetical protein [Streptomyces sp. NPDC051776]|uniref:hypothetical protein n=1 Tax=Streptomyces sp. NPDC051776 TaxID=3155414 RepID=UPI003430F4C9